jgi:hypothetical protein
MTLPLPPWLLVRNGTYHFRICVPKDIQSAAGRRLILRSLRARDLKLARAKLLFFIVPAETEFDLMRSRQRGVAIEESTTPQGRQQTKPSASTPSSWRGHKKHFKAFFGREQMALLDFLTNEAPIAVEGN